MEEHLPSIQEALGQFPVQTNKQTSFSRLSIWDICYCNGKVTNPSQ